MPILDTKGFLLGMDTLTARPWQLWVNGAAIVQSNGTNPRIRQLGTREAAELAIQLDRVLGQLYRVRVIKSEALAPTLRADARYQLSFDGGATLVDCRVIPPIAESVEQTIYWVVTLERQTSG